MSDSFVTLWTVARQTPLSMGVLLARILSGLPFLSPEVFPTQASNPHLLCLLHCITGGVFTTWATSVAYNVSYLKWMSQAFKLCEEIDDRLSWVEALEQAKRTKCQFGLCYKSCVTLTTSFKAFPGLGFRHLWNEGDGQSPKMFCILGGRLPCWLFKNSFHSEKMCVT